MSVYSFFQEIIEHPLSIIGIFLTVVLFFCIARLTLRKNVFEYLKEDWLYRLPDRLDYMPFKGLARPCYTLLCLLYYGLKTILILVFAALVHIYKFLFWDVPKRLYSVIEPAVRQHFPKTSKKEPPLATEPPEPFVHTLWYHGNEEMWKSALDFYWSDFNEHQYQRELLVNETDPKRIETLSPKEFFDFLHQTYFPWKYTDARYLSRNRKYLEKYLLENNLDELACIQKQIFSTDLQDIKKCLQIGCKIRGLGPAGSSGLFAILFPEYFGTVDQFVVYSLRKINNLPQADQLIRMNPTSLTINDGILLIEILRKKAAELNDRFHTDFWTPRKIDMVLWAVRKS